MALSEEFLELITIVRKELEDLAKQTVLDMYNPQYIAQELVTGDNNIALPGDAYDNTDYLIDVVYGVDADGIDVRAELEILEENKTLNGFVVTAERPTTARFITMRKLPKAEFYTDG